MRQIFKKIFHDKKNTPQAGEKDICEGCGNPFMQLKKHVNYQVSCKEKYEKRYGQLEKYWKERKKEKQKKRVAKHRQNPNEVDPKGFKDKQAKEKQSVRSKAEQRDLRVSRINKQTKSKV